uniref:SET domain-containing protein n=1 Tax=Heterorhabditis bacteriophora TaxID=37862 RepID=A0A1I7X352_HETBA
MGNKSSTLMKLRRRSKDKNSKIIMGCEDKRSNSSSQVAYKKNAKQCSNNTRYAVNEQKKTTPSNACNDTMRLRKQSVVTFVVINKHLIKIPSAATLSMFCYLSDVTLFSHGANLSEPSLRQSVMGITNESDFNADDSVTLLDKLTGGLLIYSTCYIYCEKCDAYYQPVCRDHPLYWVKDREVRGDNVDRAQKSVPAFVRIKASSIPHAGMGAFATTHIPAGIVFGPYQGVLINDVKFAQEDGYSWEITNKRGTVFIDGSNTQYSNWMRYINSSRLWYGKKFGETLGVFTTRPLGKRSTGKNPFIL